MMSPHFKKRHAATWMARVAVFWAIAVGVILAASPRPAPVARAGAVARPTAVARAGQPAPALAQTSGAQAGDYVGEETCLGCHDSQGESYARSAHHRAADARTPAADKGCETCHGPGSRHARADRPETVPISDPGKLPASEANALCTSCHNKGEHVLWDGSQHEMRGLACTTCHSQHAARSEKALLKGRTQLETCATCHRDKVAKLDRSGHMPVREGKMECSSCHNPHGSTNVRLLRKGDSIAELCTSCHAEKRGPYLWEHPPSRDGCATCHDPHGSSNERMLVARPPILCQRCHVATRHPSTIYDAGAVRTSLRVYARSCVTCHANIHGSNHPNGQRFVR